ncbi:MAG: DUF1800 domain-containing protein [Cyanobacteria bacterium]|nr:DUF1800 domain-containing protein [Cyanobacteriota bacterium]
MVFNWNRFFDFHPFKRIKINIQLILLFSLLCGFKGQVNAEADNFPPLSPEQKILHVLNRLTFGPTPAEWTHVKAIGVDAYIEEQLKPDSISEPDFVTLQLNQLETLRLSPLQLFDEYWPKVLASRAEKKAQNLNKEQSPVMQVEPKEIQQSQQKRQDAGIIIDQARQARILLALRSPRQLKEQLVDFWFNHFNIYSAKDKNRLWVGAFERQAIRPYVLGRFRDLLGATAHHPAMMVYLDNDKNRFLGPSDVQGKPKGVNENYARELMELHSLGVDGGYSQTDVIELARILSGWGVCPLNSRPNLSSNAMAGIPVDPYLPSKPAPFLYPNGNGFCFNPKFHDPGTKVFLGKTFQGDGLMEGERALDLLAQHPSTAKHISYQLAEYFVQDNPPPSLVNRLQARYLQTNGSIEEVLRTLFHSPEFWNPQVYQCKFKTPYQYLLSCLRATQTPVTTYKPIYGLLEQMGMPLYNYLTPEGYKNTQVAWSNPDALMRRILFSYQLGQGAFAAQLKGDRSPGEKIPLTPLQTEPLKDVVWLELSPKSQDAIHHAPNKLWVAMMLGSPEWMFR